jgi:kinesin family member 1
MVGYGEDKGIIPRACEEIFVRIDSSAAEDMSFKVWLGDQGGGGLTAQVEASMMEIYNEHVRDLFNPKNSKNEGGGAVFGWTRLLMS